MAEHGASPGIERLAIVRADEVDLAAVADRHMNITIDKIKHRAPASLFSFLSHDRDRYAVCAPAFTTFLSGLRLA